MYNDEAIEHRKQNILNIAIRIYPNAPHPSVVNANKPKTTEMLMKTPGMIKTYFGFFSTSYLFIKLFTIVTTKTSMTIGRFSVKKFKVKGSIYVTSFLFLYYHTFKKIKFKIARE